MCFFTYAKECKCVNWEVVDGSMANSNDNNRYVRTNEAIKINLNTSN